MDVPQTSSMDAAARITAPQGDAMAKRPRGPPDRSSTRERRNGCPRTLLDDATFLQDSGYKVNHFLGSYGKFVSDLLGTAREHAHACDLCRAYALTKSIRRPRLFAFDTSIYQREDRRGEECAAQGSPPASAPLAPTGADGTEMMINT